MTGKLRIAVLSDLHADSASKRGEVSRSLLNIAMAETLTYSHPIAALKERIRRDGLTADVLMCPGDVADQAKPAPLASAWKSIQEIAGLLKTQVVLATAGNHDIDSRYIYSTHDARAAVKGLSPAFPGLDRASNALYWSENYVISQHGGFRLCVLNSSAHHGGSPLEFEHGRIDQQTLEGLRRDLRQAQDADPVEAGILLCHHHPYRFSDIPVADYSEMKGGPDLIDVLGVGELGRWLIVHGHIHHPRLEYAAGGAASPVVFAAGSFSFILSGASKSPPRNQFYMLEVEFGGALSHSLHGTGLSWDFAPGVGWQPAIAGGGLPHRFGFGCRTPPEKLADDIAAGFQVPCPWGELLEGLPELQCLIPRDQDLLRAALSNRHQLTVLESAGVPVQIARAFT